MKLAVISIILIINFVFSISHADVTYLQFKDIKNNESQPNVNNVIIELEKNGLVIPIINNNSSEFVNYKYKESIYSISKLRKVKTTVIFIHGLYGGAFQFKNVFQNLRDIGSDSNGILLTLPGHYENGVYDQKLKKTSKDEWITSLADTLKIAKLTSDRVVIVGQSTGGLLAAYAAVHLPNLIDGIVLLEPSLKVQTRIEIATCLGKHVTQDAHSLSAVANLIGIDAPKGVSVSMGCEVAKLANQLVDRKVVSTNASDDSQSTQMEPAEDALKRLAAKINVPVLMVNNINDNIVDPNYNKVFSKYFKSSEYVEINADNKTQHGSALTLVPNYRNLFFRKLSDYLFLNFDDRGGNINFYINNISDIVNGYYLFTAGNEIDATKIENTYKMACAYLAKKPTSYYNCEQFVKMINDSMKYWNSAYKEFEKNKQQYKDFYRFILKYNEEFYKNNKLSKKIFNETVNYFRKYFFGIEYFDINYMYNKIYNKYQEKLKFIKMLTHEKDNLEFKCSLVELNFADDLDTIELYNKLSIRSLNVGISDFTHTIRLIKKAHHLEKFVNDEGELITKLNNFLISINSYKNSNTNDSVKLESIMVEYAKMVEDSEFYSEFDFEKVSLILNYLIEKESRAN